MTPYKSKAQMRYLHAKEPKLAEEWDEKYEVPKKLVEKVSKMKRGGKKK